MARLLAIDWNHHEARYVIASTSRSGIQIEEASSIPLKRTDDETGANPGGLIQSALAGKKVGNANALVGLGRASLQQWEFTVPPAKESELPLFVANLAMRESPNLSEDSVLDFVPETDHANESRDVTAFLLSAEQLDLINSTCAEADIVPSRVLLRQYSSASLFLKNAASTQENSLLVNLVDDEADLTVISEGNVVFLRTVRLPNVRTEYSVARQLLTEIQRTLVVLPQNKLNGEDINSVTIFGQADDHQSLIEEFRDQLDLPIHTFDAFQAAGASSDVVPDDSGRFASLLGMLTDEASGRRHTIDFLNPRKPAEPRDLKRTILVAAGAVLAAAIVSGWWINSALSEADDENAALASRLDELNDLVKRVEKKQKVIDAVAEWKTSNVTWLDELRDLSLRFPGRNEVMLSRLTIAPSQGGGGTVKFQGVVRDPSTVTNFEQNLRDEFHELRTPRVEERPQNKSHPWHFETSMRILPREKDRYVSHLTAKQLAARQIAMATANQKQKKRGPTNRQSLKRKKK